MPSDLSRQGDPDDLEDRGHTVDDVVKLGADRPNVGDVGRVMNNQRIASAALVNRTLVPTVRRVARLRPAGCIVWVALGRSPRVEPCPELVERVGYAVDVADHVEGALR